MKKRTCFVSNSSSSSYIVDEDSFNNWLNKGNEFKLNYNVGSLYHYIESDPYEFYPICKSDPSNYFYTNLKDSDFEIIDDDKYISKFMDCDEQYYYIPESLKLYRDKFFKLWNEIVIYRIEIKHTINYENDSKYKQLKKEYRTLENNYVLDVVKLIKSKIKDMSLIRFCGHDDSCSVDGYYDDEAYVRYVASEISNPIFWREDTCH